MTEVWRPAPALPLSEPVSGDETLTFTFALPAEFQELATLTQAARPIAIEVTTVSQVDSVTRNPTMDLDTTLREDGAPSDTVQPELTAQHTTTAETTSDPVAKLAAKVNQAATQQAAHFQQNYQHVATAVETGAQLLGALTSIFKFAAAACPHCAVVALQGTAQAGRMLGLGGVGLGHWHADGTYHEGEHDHHTPSENNPFLWLRVEAPAPKKRKAA